jgi:hypothetical protein
MASAQSSALRSMPGYVSRPTVAASYGGTTTPTFSAIPTAPAIANAPNAIGRDWLQTQISAIPGSLNPALTAINANERAALAGYGGVTFGPDDPSTPQREDLLPKFDPNAKLGQIEKNAVDNQRWAANATGDMNSSFADKNVGAALTRLGADKQAIVANFSTQISNAIQSAADRTTSLVSDWAQLYGQDSAWLVDHPPPVVPTSYDLHPGNPNGVAYQDPATTATAPAQNHMAYSDFLRGRKSTPALAHEWDAKYNYGRRFG